MNDNDSAFNPAHPPLMTDPDNLPPENSGALVVGSYSITKDHFDLVTDPRYPWQTMNHNSPSEWEKWKQTKADKLANVDHYQVLRTRYWHRVSRKTYANNVTEQVTNVVGATYTHSEGQTRSITTRIGMDLGLDLSGGDLFAGGEVPPIPPVMATQGALAQTAPLGASTFNLSAELSRTLEYRQEDTSSYDYRHEVMTTTEFLADYQYLNWQVCEAIEIYRVPSASGNDKELVSSVPANTTTTYNDRILMKPATPPSL
ncbi:hypothetical protein DM813_18145 [Pseudomonas alkylphenolica]|uniref:Uncharacterized protein n=1 Tax=Pseudomonas alkylphenolica TaxID=237609 RepID=A0A443ZPX2_9PSED|nr:hypothetical protein [Pseudomonas alkylphenolica]RWU21124.1 hypothetical protein DM813_18145 [Pseudomonas alkylphenolica]